MTTRSAGMICFRNLVIGFSICLIGIIASIIVRNIYVPPVTQKCAVCTSHWPKACIGASPEQFAEESLRLRRGRQPKILSARRLHTHTHTHTHPRKNDEKKSNRKDTHSFTPHTQTHTRTHTTATWRRVDSQRGPDTIASRQQHHCHCGGSHLHLGAEALAPRIVHPIPTL